MTNHLQAGPPGEVERFPGVLQLSIWVRVFPKGGREHFIKTLLNRKPEEILEVDLTLENGDEVQGLVVKSVIFSDLGPRVFEIDLNHEGGIIVAFTDAPVVAEYKQADLLRLSLT